MHGRYRLFPAARHAAAGQAHTLRMNSVWTDAARRQQTIAGNDCIFERILHQYPMEKP
jgi:hypothetical protein